MSLRISAENGRFVKEDMTVDSWQRDGEVIESTVLRGNGGQGDVWR